MNFIHPTSIIEKEVELGDNNYIGPFCYITGNTKIGDNNRFEGYCSIGTPAEHTKYFTTSGKLLIGDNNIFREFTTANTGTTDTTIIGNTNIILRSSYIGHDSIIESNITFSCSTLIGGHSYIMSGVNFGLGSICHQYSKIGAYSMIGMGAVVTKKTLILPGGVYVGIPAKFLKPNTVGLERNNITDQILQELTDIFYTL